MRVFDFIPKYHFKDAARNEELERGALPGEMWILVQDRYRGYWNQVMTRFCPALPLQAITPEWCRGMVQEAARLSGHDPLRVEVHPDEEHEVVYLPKEDCYRIFTMSRSGWIPVCERRGQMVCSDQVELQSLGIHPYMAVLEDLNEAFLNPSIGEDGRPGGRIYLNGWERYLDVTVLQEAATLLEGLKTERLDGHSIFPPQEKIFRALVLTPPEQVKVVILGQDPYCEPDYADGLAFSVQDGSPVPQTLRNIFHVLQRDVGVVAPFSGDLTGWAEQGVLLLNTVLTVEEGKPLSHAQRGWQKFTGAVLDVCSKLPQPIVFILPGMEAVVFAGHFLRPSVTHHEIRVSHPDPQTAGRETRLAPAFLTSHIFSETNSWLNRCSVGKIHWEQTRPENDPDLQP